MQSAASSSFRKHSGSCLIFLKTNLLKSFNKFQTTDKVNVCGLTKTHACVFCAFCVRFTVWRPCLTVIFYFPWKPWVTRRLHHVGASTRLLRLFACKKSLRAVLLLLFPKKATAMPRFLGTLNVHGNREITKVPYSKACLAMWRFCLFWGGLTWELNLSEDDKIWVQCILFDLFKHNSVSLSRYSMPK